MNVLLADQHSHTRLGLEMLLNREPGVVIAGSVGNSAGLLALAGVAPPDIVILETALPGLPTATLIGHLKAKTPTVQIILLCSDTTDNIAPLVGAAICVRKSAYPATLLAAFRALCQTRQKSIEIHHLPRR